MKALYWITALRPLVGTAINSKELYSVANLIKKFEIPNNFAKLLDIQL